MNAKFFMPFETAKLLRKAGYPQSGSDMYYNPNGKLMTQAEVIAGYKDVFPISITDCYAAPAYCEVLDWMIENRIAVITTNANDTMRGLRWYCDILFIDGDTIRTEECVTREESINSAIIGALDELSEH